MRVLVGIVEVANIIRELGDALADAGWKVDTLAVKNRFYPSNRYTYTVSLPTTSSRVLRYLALRCALLWRFIPLVLKYDVFVFVWTVTFLPGQLDLLLLRLLGKKVIVFNCGDDVRFRPIHNRLDEALLGRSTWPELPGLTGNRHFLRTFYAQKLEELACSRLVSTRNQATFQKKPFYFFRCPARRLIAQPKKAAAIPLIIHAPTDPTTKGTAYVTAAVDILRRDGLAFDFELIRDRENDYVIQRLLQADVLIDQPSTWIARLAMEAMAAGCAVVGGNNPDYEGLGEEHSPVIPFHRDAEALATSLRPLLVDARLRQKLMAESHAYWLGNYSPEAFVRFFSRLLDGTGPQVSPQPGHKALLLKSTRSRLQRAVISAFY